MYSFHFCTSHFLFFLYSFHFNHQIFHFMSYFICPISYKYFFSCLISFVQYLFFHTLFHFYPSKFIFHVILFLPLSFIFPICYSILSRLISIFLIIQLIFNFLKLYFALKTSFLFIVNFHLTTVFNFSQIF